MGVIGVIDIDLGTGIQGDLRSLVPTGLVNVSCDWLGNDRNEHNVNVGDRA